jgi:hypothetical protein
MLYITLDMGGLIARLEDMSKKLEEFPKQMADELTAWQTEDMRRRYPNTETEENAVSTEIWPTSRVVERDQKKINKIIKARKSSNMIGTVKRSGSTRPILRPELYDKLVARMDELMAKDLTWR